MELMVSTLSDEDQKAFTDFAKAQNIDDLAHQVTMPESKNPTCMFATKTAFNDKQLGEWHEVTMPRLKSISEKWSKLDLSSASDEELLAGIREMGIYGIPAVLGVGTGTKRIKHGQMITIDGDAGSVVIYEEEIDTAA